MNVPDIARPFAILQASCPEDETLDAVYGEHCHKIFDTVKDFVPDPCKRIVDIGGGLAGPSLLLAKETGASLYVIDGDEEHGLPEKRCQDQPFNSFNATKAFQKANGMSARKLICLPLTLDGLPATVDMVVSFAAWGFHFRVERYLAIAAKMNAGAKLVLDLRTDHRGTQDMVTLAPYFNQVSRLTLSEKRIRTFYERNDAPFPG
jgi:hypothetical protein